MPKLNSPDIDFRALSSCIRSCIWVYPLAAHALFGDFRQWWAIMNLNISGRFFFGVEFFREMGFGADCLYQLYTSYAVENIVILQRLKIISPRR